MAIGLASLQTAPEAGNRDDWFGSQFIVRLSVVGILARALFFWIELTTPPVAQPAPAAAAQLRAGQRCQRNPRHGAAWLGVSTAESSVAASAGKSEPRRIEVLAQPHDPLVAAVTR
jgi:hypothetical protein